MKWFKRKKSNPTLIYSWSHGCWVWMRDEKLMVCRKCGFSLSGMGNVTDDSGDLVHKTCPECSHSSVIYDFDRGTAVCSRPKCGKVIGGDEK